MKSAKRIISALLSLLMLLGTLGVSGISLFSFSDEEENIAVGKTVITSLDDLGCPGSNIVDDNISSYWDGGVCPAEAVVDLGAFYDISKVNVVTYYEDGRAYQYKIEASTNDDTYTLVAEKKDNARATSQGETYDCTFTARYVKITVTHNSANPSAHVCELRIYGKENPTFVDDSEKVTVDPEDADNIAFKRPTRANSNSNAALKVVDGKTNTYWSAEDFPRYVDIDLEANYAISDITIWQPTNTTFSYNIYGSLDGINFDKIAAHPLAQPNAKGDTYKFDKPIEYRIIRVNVTSNADTAGKVAMISEVRVHGTPVNSPVTPTREKMEFTSYEEWLKNTYNFDVATIADANGRYDISKTYTEKDTIDAVRGIISRNLGDKYNDWFTFELAAGKDGYDYFEIVSTSDGKINIKGNKGLSLATGLNYYLKYYCKVSITQQTSQVNMPASAPKVKGTYKKTSPYEVRYAYNYCTLSYTMCFYGFDEWQRELDYLALNGINLILDTTATEALWVYYLQQLGYSADQAKDFVCGYAYKAWWLMGNLEGYGGSVSDQWIYDTLEMARRNERFMTVLGIQPALQAFYGMFPNNFASVAKDRLSELGFKSRLGTCLVDQGAWSGFHRPILLNNTYDGYDTLAKMFYDSQDYIYGQITDYYCGDICHEGGVFPTGNTREAMSERILDLMIASDPDAVWILQVWWSNPTKETLTGFGDNREDHILLLDLAAAHSPKYTDTSTYGGKEFMGTSWVYCILDNYGGRTGMHGSLKSFMRTMVQARSASKHMKGIGITPEGTEQNPIVYELFWELGWETQTIKINTWIENYVERRYGVKSDNAAKAWEDLLETVYNKDTVDGTSINTVMNNYPAFGTGGSYFEANYKNSRLESAINYLMKDFDTLKDNENYIYDLVDAMRQWLSNTSFYYYDMMQKANNSKKYDDFLLYSKKFIDTMKLIDEISGYQEDSLLGNWLGRTTDWQNDPRTGYYDDYTVDMMRFNAGALITIWASRSLANYAYRQYNGLMRDYYIPMWQTFIDSVANNLSQGRTATSFPSQQRYFSLAMQVAAGDTQYTTETYAAGGDEYSRGLDAVYANMLANHADNVKDKALVSIETKGESGLSLFDGVLSGIAAGTQFDSVKAQLSIPAGATLTCDAQGALVTGSKIVLTAADGNVIDSCVVEVAQSEEDEKTIKRIKEQLCEFLSEYRKVDTSDFDEKAAADVAAAIAAADEYATSLRQHPVGEYQDALKLAQTAKATIAEQQRKKEGDDDDDDPTDPDDTAPILSPVKILIIVAVVVVAAGSIVILEVKKNKKMKANKKDPAKQDPDASKYDDE